jgi:hypothetical protein
MLLGTSELMSRCSALAVARVGAAGDAESHPVAPLPPVETPLERSVSRVHTSRVPTLALKAGASRLLLPLGYRARRASRFRALTRWRREPKPSNLKRFRIHHNYPKQFTSFEGDIE